MITNVITNTVYPKVKHCLSDKNNAKAFFNIVNSFVDRNIEKLSMIGPIKRVLFPPSEHDKIYNLINITPEVIEAAVNSTDYIKAGTIPGKPFNILMTMIIRFFTLEKMERETHAAIVYFTLSLYPSLHSKYFKYEPNEQIMTFTINAMTNKYKIKQKGTVLAALTDTTEVSHKHYINELKRGNDKDIADYILSYQTRLNGLMKNICAAFMEVHKERKFMNYETDNEDEENFQQADSNSYLISRVADSVAMSLSVRGPNSTIIVAAAKMADIPVSDLRNTVTAICKGKDTKEDMKRMVNAILYLFFFDGNNDKADMNGSKFLLFCVDVYKKANTKNPNIVTIKEILNKWLERYSEGYKKTNRVATLNNFRRGLYLFFVFTIQRTNV